MMTTYEESILEAVRKLNKLEKDFLKFSYESKRPSNKRELDSLFEKLLGISVGAFETRNKILADFHDITDLVIHDSKVLRTLDKIKQNEKFYSISFYEGLAEKFNTETDNGKERLDVSIEDYLFSESIEWDLVDEFHSWFDVYKYYSAKIKIGPIISSFHIPNSIRDYFDELREVYAFGHYRSSVALCRALLEMSLFDKLNKKGYFKKQKERVISIDIVKEDNLYKFINTAKFAGILKGNKVDVAHKIRTSSNRVLHLKDNESELSEKRTFKIIFDTIQIVESLYR